MRKVLFIFAAFLSAVGVSAQSNNVAVQLPEPDELHILSTEDKVPAGTKDSYMRIVLDRSIKAGEWTLISFPAKFDGYYFGPEAERYKVTACDLTTAPVTLQREKIADLDDFAANQMYLVKSKADLDSIVSLSPGVKTAVPKADGVTLICLTLDDFQEPTAVMSVNAADLKDTQKIYDLNGRLAKTVRRGIYIINGKKVFEK